VFNGFLSTAQAAMQIVDVIDALLERLHLLILNHHGRQEVFH
jgi:hypothetical protein